MIPERFALGMIERGWILRNKIIWNKPNHMPSSVKDRFGNSWEYMFMFSKSKKYYFDLDAVREKHKADNKTIERAKIYDRTNTQLGDHQNGRKKEIERGKRVTIEYNPSGKNPGDSWTITTQPFPEAHFAVFPEKLVERPIKTTPRWICKKCGKARKRIVETNNPSKDTLEWDNNRKSGAKGSFQSRQSIKSLHRNNGGVYYSGKTVGWTKCNCNAGFHPAVIMDIFAGAGTTCVVAKKQGRNYIGIELNPKYIEIAKRRLNKVPVRLDIIKEK